MITGGDGFEATSQSPLLHFGKIGGLMHLCLDGPHADQIVQLTKCLSEGHFAALERSRIRERLILTNICDTPLQIDDKTMFVCIDTTLQIGKSIACLLHKMGDEPETFRRTFHFLKRLGYFGKTHIQTLLDASLDRLMERLKTFTSPLDVLRKGIGKSHLLEGACPALSTMKRSRKWEKKYP